MRPCRRTSAGIDLRGAQERYRQVLRAEPDSPAAIGNLAVIAIAERDYGIVEKYLREVL